MGERTWPNDWEDKMAGKDCPMCANRGKADTGFGVIIHAGTFADTYLQRSRPTKGYCVAIWKLGHVPELTKLDEASLAGYWQDNMTVARALKNVYKPAKLNYQVLGNAVPHLHTHIVLRYLYDAAPGAPLSMDESAMTEAEEPAFSEEVAVLRAAVEGDIRG